MKGNKYNLTSGFADAEAAQAKADGELVLAETALASARTAHQTARAAVVDAEATAEADETAANKAKRTAEAARAAATKAAGNGATTTLDGARVTVTPAPAAPDAIALAAAADEAEIDAAAKADVAERSQRALNQAQPEFRQKAAALTAAETAVTDARAALADATDAATAAGATADEMAQALRAVEMEGSAATTAAGDAATAAKEAAALVGERTAARDELTAQVEAARAAVEEAAAAAETKTLGTPFAVDFYNRAIAYSDEGDYDRAIVDYDQAIRLNPDYGYAYYGRGIAYVAKGDSDMAHSDFREAARLIPLKDPMQQAALARFAETEKKLAATNPKGSGPAVNPPEQAEQPVTSSVAAKVGRRVALVIGNSDYEAVAELANPHNDAIAVAETLRGIGFDDVRMLEDLDQTGLRRALKAFSDVAAGAETAVIYYAGHGVEVDGRNYLVPVDAELARAPDVEFEAVPLDMARTAVSGASELQLIILDACRSNPFRLASNEGGRSVGRGLARVESRGNEIIAYAAREGTIASDGTDEGNSPYAAALIKYMAEPGLEIRLLFGRIRDEVMRTTGDRQEPIVYTSLGGDAVYLKPPSTPVTAVAPAQGVQGVNDDAVVAEDYRLAERVGTIAAWDAFLAKHGRRTDNFHVQLARAGREKLSSLMPLYKPDGPAVEQPDDCDGGVVASVGNAGVAEEATRCLKSGDMFRDCPNCPEMVVIPSGTFMMGSPPNEDGRDEDEGPQSEVTISKPLAVGKFEVTFNEWDACIADGGCGGYLDPDDVGWGRGRRPVINVSWEDANAYVAWLSRKTGTEYRLLSESEWEYAARAGTATRFTTGQTITVAQAKFSPRSGSTDEVGNYAANPFGLHDMLGNALEWVEDCYKDSYKDARRDGSAVNIRDCNRRVVRGGSWRSSSWSLRCAARDWVAPDVRNYVMGFRIARPLAPLTDPVGLIKPALDALGSVDPGGWEIQIATMSTEAAALALLESAREAEVDLIDRASHYTEPVAKGSKTLYRARFAGFADRQEAEAACVSLRKKGFVCYPIERRTSP